MFTSICGEHQSGFQITLENGWTVSIMFGPLAYGSNRPDWKEDCFEWDNNFKAAQARGTTAEVWAFHNTYDEDKRRNLPTKLEQNNYKLAHHYPEDPLGWKGTFEVLEFINHVSNLPLPATRMLGIKARKKEAKLTLDESEQLQQDITFFTKDQSFPDKLITELCQVVVDYTLPTSIEEETNG